ncbi:MAG: hypothetical protein R2758_15950 [Bacteroidales bacterium]
MTGKQSLAHPNGETSPVSRYSDGRPGKYIEYGAGGTVIKTSSYLGNNMNNYWNFHTADGSIENSAYYVNGLLNGWHTNYSVDGEIKSRDRFIDGRIVMEKYGMTLKAIL